MKNLFLAFLIGGFLSTAHAQLNDYKYIVVPKKFEDFKRENQYQTSTLVKYLFTEKGFNTVYNDQLPIDLTGNRCLGLWVHLKDDSSMFSTKTTLVLTDCADREVFATQEGKSKVKEFKEAYNDAIRKAFASFNTVSYSYNGNEGNVAPVTVSFKNDVQHMENETTPKNKQNQSVVAQEATTEKQTYKSVAPVTSNMQKAPSATSVGNMGAEAVSGTLYAQELPEGNGYQLVDGTPQIVMKIFKTSVPGNYMAKMGETDGVLLEKEGKWVFEYYHNGALKAQELDIKF